MSVNLATGVNTGGDAQGDTLLGGVGDDVVRMNGDAAVADGGAGDDLVVMRAVLTETLPDGTIYQGVSGTLEGGAGTDTIRLESATSAARRSAASRARS